MFLAYRSDHQRAPFNADTGTCISSRRLILLSEARRNAGGRIRLPDHIRGGAAERLLRRLIAGRLFKRDDLPGSFPDRSASGCEVSVDPQLTFRITAAGLAVIGVGNAVNDVSDISTFDRVRDAVGDPGDHAYAASSPKTASSKVAEVVALLQRPGGATVVEVQAATGWQVHTIRAAISRLRKLGHAISLGRQAEGSAYRIDRASVVPARVGAED